MTTMLRRGTRTHDAGSAMIAVIMLMMVVAALGVGVTQVAQHSNNATSVDRERLQTIEAAEAGANDAIRRIQAGAGCDAGVSGYNDLKDQDRVVGRFRTRIDPEAGTTCGQTPRRVIHSWGYAPTGGTRALRHLEVQVELVPTAGFPYTLFAEGSTGTIYVKNNGTIDGDAYAESFDQSKNNLAAHNVVSPGGIVTKNNVGYAGSLWSGGNVTIGDNGNIGGSIIASGTAAGTQGTVTLNNGVVVGGDVTAKGAVSSSGATVNGSISQNNSNAPPPPLLVKPTFTWNAANYTPAPTQGTAAAITTALNTAKNNLQGTYRSTDSGTIMVPSGAIVTGPLTIVSTGKLEVNGTMSFSGGPWQVVMVAQSTAADAMTAGSSFTGGSGLDILFFTNGGWDVKNNVTFKGAIYADYIDAKNTFTITRATSLMTTPPVGFTFTSASTSTYSAIPTLWREIVPGLPPS